MMKKGTQYLFRFLVSLSILFAVGNLSGQACPDGMISYLKMQEIGGPTYNDSYGNHDAFSPGSAGGITGLRP